MKLLHGADRAEHLDIHGLDRIVAADADLLRADDEGTDGVLGSGLDHKADRHALAVCTVVLRQNFRRGDLRILELVAVEDLIRTDLKDGIVVKLQLIVLRRHGSHGVLRLHQGHVLAQDGVAQVRLRARLVGSDRFAAASAHHAHGEEGHSGDHDKQDEYIDDVQLAEQAAVLDDFHKITSSWRKKREKSDCFFPQNIL